MADFATVEVNDSLIDLWIQEFANADDVGSGDTQYFFAVADHTSNGDGTTGLTQTANVIISMDYNLSNFIENKAPTADILVTIPENRWFEECRIYWRKTGSNPGDHLVWSHTPGAAVEFEYGGEFVIPSFKITFTTTVD